MTVGGGGSDRAGWIGRKVREWSDRFYSDPDLVGAWLLINMTIAIIICVLGLALYLTSWEMQLSLETWFLLNFLTKLETFPQLKRIPKSKFEANRLRTSYNLTHKQTNRQKKEKLIYNVNKLFDFKRKKILKNDNELFDVAMKLFKVFFL